MDALFVTKKREIYNRYIFCIMFYICVCIQEKNMLLSNIIGIGIVEEADYFIFWMKGQNLFVEDETGKGNVTNYFRELYKNILFIDEERIKML